MMVGFAVSIYGGSSLSRSSFSRSSYVDLPVRWAESFKPLSAGSYQSGSSACSAESLMDRESSVLRNDFVKESSVILSKSVAFDGDRPSRSLLDHELDTKASPIRLQR